MTEKAESSENPKLGKPQEIVNVPPDQDRGLYRKYELLRVNEDGSLRYQVTDPFFALRFATDPYAIPALAAYADACEAEFPALAADLRHTISVIPTNSSEGSN